jgi:cytochrome P450
MTSTLPVSAADPFSPALLADPAPLHAALRDAGPVVYLSALDVYGLARHAEVHAALTDWQRFQSGAGVGLADFRREPPFRPPSLLLEADPPRHDAPRAVLTAILSARSLRPLREEWLADAAELVGKLAAVREFDAVPALCEAFPLRVFPDAVGIPRAGREHLLPYGDMLFNYFGPANDLVAAYAGRVGELSAWASEQCRREALAPGSFGAQIWAAADRGDLTPEQAPLVVRSLLSAGVDTTVHALGAVLYALATHPEQWQRLRQSPGLVRVAFDEAVRWASPVQTFFRTATADVPVGGAVIPDGRKILMFLGSANRDPRRWDRPDSFDLERDPSAHVGFGMGIHQCVGQHVARLEAEAVLTALLSRVESLELAGTPRRHPNNTLRAWASLPLRVRPS